MHYKPTLCQFFLFSSTTTSAIRQITQFSLFIRRTYPFYVLYFESSGTKGSGTWIGSNSNGTKRQKIVCNLIILHFDMFYSNTIQFQTPAKNRTWK